MIEFSFETYRPSEADVAPCLAAGTHQPAQHHSLVDCPADVDEKLYRARTPRLDKMEWDIAYTQTEVDSPAPTYCTRCGIGTTARTDLFVVAHPTPTGHVTYYLCDEHLPTWGQARSASPGAARRGARLTVAPVVCEVCFQTKSVTGVCGCDQ